MSLYVQMYVECDVPGCTSSRMYHLAVARVAMTSQPLPDGWTYKRGTHPPEIRCEHHKDTP